MFFKRVEMVGFKSFATKTTVEFIPGTTIIVGPNGCGKSNILDAIKWVLGEQAASQMRGKKMSDVIFAGSASFKPLGVAQVTLTVDNSRRILPVEYDEVQVTRRLFRSGESEYQINKTPCRLRDVHDLFLGTGIGKSAYSILEQGRVDQIINTRPQERRFLIEEAAGISKFKVRKLEALRKLERTDVDLSRLNDLLSEVERQTNSLKRQASKAERYKQLFEASRQAEQELLLLRRGELTQKLESYSRTMSGLKDQLTALRTALAVQSAAEETAREREFELTDRLTDENQAIFDLKANLTACEGQITRLNDKIASHAHRIAQIHEELREQQKRAEDLGLRREEADLRRQQAEDARQHHQHRHEELRGSYDAMQHSVREQTQLIEDLSSELNRLRETISRADNEVRTAEALIQQQDEVHREVVASLETLEQNQGDLDRRHTELSTQSEMLTAAIAQLEGTLGEQRRLQAERQQQLATMLREIEQIRKDLHSSLSRLETLNELKASYEGYYQGVREVMLAVDGGRLRGVRGVVANLVHAQKDHEIAIEVALATHLQDIVTATADDAREAINYLKSAGRGRATFLPLDHLQVSPLHGSLRQALGRPGVLGVASELVQFDPSIRPAVEFMLGQTIVVEDLDVALALSRQGMRARYVSLDGQLINPAGSMTGGRVKATGLMMREREIRDLGEAVERLEKRQQELRGRIEAVQSALQTGHETIERDQKELDRSRLEENSLRKDLEALARSREDARRGVDEKYALLERIDQEVGRRRESIDQWRAQREEKGAQFALAEQNLAAARDAARTRGDDIMNLGTAVAEARAEADKARERAEDATREIETLNRDLEGQERQREARQREIETLQQEDVLLQVQIDRIRQETEDSRIEYDRRARQLNQDQTEREQLLAEIKVCSAAVETMTRDERKLDNQFREIELEHAELSATLGSLAENCQERFDITLDALAGQFGPIDKDPHALQTEVAELRDKLGRIGPVNMAALEEYQEQLQRLEFLQGQHTDLNEARQQLEATIKRLDDTTRQLFHETFEAVRGHFIEMFRKLFNGGKADLILEAPDGVDPLLDGGVEILAQPPGKKLQSITLLSGGEKAMTAISLLFALFLQKPSPFCILDEIDAPLDDANVGRFARAVDEFKRATQFVVITHNKLTMELADAIYGVTMEESGVSKVVSVRFDQADQFVDAG